MNIKKKIVYCIGMIIICLLLCLILIYKLSNKNSVKVQELLPTHDKSSIVDTDNTVSELLKWQMKSVMEIDAPGDIPVGSYTTSKECSIMYFYMDAENTPHYYIYCIKANGDVSISECQGISSDMNIISFASRDGFHWLLMENIGVIEKESSSILLCLEEGGKVIYKNMLPYRVYGTLYADAGGIIWIEDHISRKLISFGRDGIEDQIIKMPEEGLDMITEGKNSRMIGLYSYRDGSGTCIYAIGEKGVEQKIFWEENDLDVIYPGLQGLLLYSTDGILYKYYPESDHKIKLLSFSECGINAQLIYGIILKDNNELLVLCQGSELNKIRLYNIENRIDAYLHSTINLAVLGNNNELQELVTLYNRSGRSYHIVTKSYSDLTAEADVMTKLNADLISGDIDVIDLSYTEDSSIRKHYAEQGFLDDIYLWMERDEDFHISDYQIQVWKANEINNSLYNLVPYYQIDTVFGRKSLYGQRWQITPEEVFDIEDPILIYGRNYTYHDVLREYCQYVLSGSIEEIISEIENTARLQMLFRFAAGYPDIPVGGESIIDMYEGRQMMEAVGNNSTKGITRSLERYMSCKALMGEDVFFTGYPVKNGIGSAFYNVVSLGMCSASQNKEGVWDFFKFLLDERTQNNLTDFIYLDHAIPVSLSAWDATCKTAMSLEEGNGAGIVRKDMEWFVIFPVITEEEVGYLNELISKISRVREYDYVLYAIIEEEMNNYRNKTVSLEESVRRFQNRANIYLYENR